MFRLLFKKRAVGNWTTEVLRGVLVVLVTFSVLTSSEMRAQDSQKRYEACFDDGTRLFGDELLDWHRADGAPKLQGNALLSESRPLRALIDRRLSPQGEPEVFVELVTGDRLPGRVIGFRSGKGSVFEPLAPHFLVDVTETDSSIQQPAGRPVRVIEEWVRRIVWDHASHSHNFEPQTVFLRDGGRLRFRAARFIGSRVTLLLEDGARNVDFDEIQEIHFAQANTWGKLLDELAILTPSAAGRLMQLEAVDGLLATASMERFQARTRTAPTLADQWEHGIQPAWCLDMLWVQCGAVRIRRMFAPHHVPLTRIFPRARHESLLGGAPWPHRVNRNVRGGPLRIAGGEQGWGFGVQAASELRFALPTLATGSTLATGFETRFGLDRIVGAGGCVEGWIRQVDSRGNTVGENFHTGVLAGSEEGVTSGGIKLQPPEDDESHELILQVGTAHENRPPGADPLDIRDTADWGFPTLLLDSPRLAQALRQRRTAGTSAWAGWQIAGAENAQRLNGFVSTSGGDDRFQAAYAAAAEPLLFSREAPVGPHDHWLVLNASHLPGKGPAPTATIRIAGEVVSEQPIPVWQNSPFDRRPIALSLDDHRHGNEPLAIEVVQAAGDGTAPVIWHGLAITSQHPSLHRAFEEGSEQPPLGEAAASHLIHEDSYRGERCLELAPGESVDLTFDPPLLVRERPKPGECRFLRFAVRSTTAEGDVLVSLLDEDLADTTAIYAAGPQEPDDPVAKRLSTTPFAADWVEFTRDVYGDFGKRTIRGLRLTGIRGESIRFDSIYLARVQNDFSMAAPRRTQE